MVSIVGHLLSVLQHIHIFPWLFFLISQSFLSFFPLVALLMQTFVSICITVWTAGRYTSKALALLLYKKYILIYQEKYCTMKTLKLIRQKNKTVIRNNICSHILITKWIQISHHNTWKIPRMFQIFILHHVAIERKHYMG